ncbi:MAG: hypothetical protein ACE5GZ_09240 [Gammaproteobacteria bacterium]
MTSKFQTSASRRRGSPAHAARRHLSRSLTVTLMITILSTLSISPALARNDSERIRVLEEKLERAMQAVESLQQQVTALEQRVIAGQTQTVDLPQQYQQAPAVSPDADAQIQEFEARLEETEQLISEIDGRVGNRAVTRAFDAKTLNIGGFLDLGTTHAQGADGSATSFNRQVFELLLSANLYGDWDLFLAQAFARKSAADFSDRRNPDFADINSISTDTVLAWANYRHNDWLNLQAGRFITPHGIVNIEHFPALLLDPEQPQFLRPFNGQTLFPNFMDGLQVHGTRFFGETGQSSLNYHIYTGNFAGNAGHFNYGGRLAYTAGSSGLTLGANLAGGERTDQVNSDYRLYGADLRYDKGPLLWKNEVFVTDEDRGGDRFAFYTQPAWRMSDRWTLFYRFDYLDAGADPANLIEVGRSTENVLGLSFRPNSNVHLRSIWSYKSFDSTNLLSSDDAWLWELSATMSF